MTKKRAKAKRLEQFRYACVYKRPSGREYFGGMMMDYPQNLPQPSEHWPCRIARVRVTEIVEPPTPKKARKS